MEKMAESNAVLKILCLEDVLKDAELLNEILADAGYLVSMDIVAKEKEYTAFLKSRNYDIILADYTLPGFNALAALKIAQKQQPEVPFICVSGTIGEERAVELLKQGAIDYVLKDSLSRLVFAVQQALDGAEQRKKQKKAEAETTRLMNVLEVHQIELEMQNQELLLAKEQEAVTAKKYIELYDFSPSGYFTLSISGEIIELNLIGAKMLGKERSRLKNGQFGFFVSIDTRVIFSQFLENVFSSKVKETCDVTLLDNSNVPVYLHLTGIAAENGLQCLITMVDITKRIQAEEALNDSMIRIQNINKDLILAKNKAEESDILKSAFLANMSHEIRTPLNAIIGFSELLSEPNLSKENHTNFVTIINKNSEQLLSVISDVLDISKIETGQFTIVSELVDINILITELFVTYKKIVALKRLDLEYSLECPNELIQTKTDGNRVKQVICNLLNNSIKFTTDGKIEFGYKIKENFIEFYVKDTGIGLNTADQILVFERFRQVHTSKHPINSGNGLGLSISKALVEKLGGTFTVDSELGIGSTFTFTIPHKKRNR